MIQISFNMHLLYGFSTPVFSFRFSFVTVNELPRLRFVFSTLSTSILLFRLSRKPKAFEYTFAGISDFLRSPCDSPGLIIYLRIVFAFRFKDHVSLWCSLMSLCLMHAKRYVLRNAGKYNLILGTYSSKAQKEILVLDEVR